jgi:hypothetical protein
MAKIIKVRCNGGGKHINEVDIDKITRPTIVVRGHPKQNLQDRYVLPCQHCTEGKVIITRKMIEEM